MSEPRARSAIPLALTDGVREEGKGWEGKGRGKRGKKTKKEGSGLLVLLMGAFSGHHSCSSISGV